MAKFKDLKGVEPVVWPVHVLELYQIGYKTREQAARLQALKEANQVDSELGTAIGAAMIRGYADQYSLGFLEGHTTNPPGTNCYIGDYPDIELEHGIMKSIGPRIGVQAVFFSFDYEQQRIIAETMSAGEVQHSDNPEEIALCVAAGIRETPPLDDEQPYALRLVYEHSEARWNFYHAIRGVSGEDYQPGR